MSYSQNLLDQSVAESKPKASKASIKSNAKKTLSTMIDIMQAIEMGKFSLEEIAEIGKTVTKVRRSHKDYVKPVKASHIANRKNDLDKILNQVYGWNKALTVTKSLIKEGTIDPRTWIKEDESYKYNESQVKYCTSSVKKMKAFLTPEQRDFPSLTPKMVMNAIVKAATMKQTLFLEAKALKF